MTTPQPQSWVMIVDLTFTVPQVYPMALGSGSLGGGKNKDMVQNKHLDLAAFCFVFSWFVIFFIIDGIMDLVVTFSSGQHPHVFLTEV